MPRFLPHVKIPSAKPLRSCEALGQQPNQCSGLALLGVSNLGPAFGISPHQSLNLRRPEGHHPRGTSFRKALRGDTHELLEEFMLNRVGGGKDSLFSSRSSRKQPSKLRLKLRCQLCPQQSANGTPNFAPQKPPAKAEPGEKCLCLSRITKEN